MHQPLLIIDAFFQGNHGLSPADALNVVYLKNDILGVGGILSPNLTKDIELPCGDMGYSYVWYFCEAFQYELCLVCFFKKYAHIGNKGIPQLHIIQGK